MNNIPLAWWIQVVEIPALAGLFLWMKSFRTQSDYQRDHLREILENRIENTRDILAAHKVETAQKYTSVSYIRNLEKRITDHLIRIEEKLEGRNKEWKN